MKITKTLAGGTFLLGFLALSVSSSQAAPQVTFQAVEDVMATATFVKATTKTIESAEASSLQPVEPAKADKTAKPKPKPKPGPRDEGDGD